MRTEIKKRGLPIIGNKNELVERLQLAIQDQSLLDETPDEDIDEDAVLGVSANIEFETKSIDLIYIYT